MVFLRILLNHKNFVKKKIMVYLMKMVQVGKITMKKARERQGKNRGQINGELDSFPGDHLSILF